MSSNVTAGGYNQVIIFYVVCSMQPVVNERGSVTCSKPPMACIGCPTMLLELSQSLTSRSQLGHSEYGNMGSVCDREYKSVFRLGLLLTTL